MRRFDVVLLLILLATGSAIARAQSVRSATISPFSITAGGTASLFQPKYIGGWTNCSGCSVFPVSQNGNQPLLGIGAYVDMKLTHWVQLEAEGRWQRFNAFNGITEDNYLIGPRVPVFHIWKATAYAKALGGFSNIKYGLN